MTNHCDLVIFGATGDLALRKLLPALYRSYSEKSLSGDFKIHLTCRSNSQKDSYLTKLKDSLQEHLSENEFCSETWLQFKKRLFPIQLDIENEKHDWQQLEQRLDNRRERIFYLSIAPSLYALCCRQLARFKLINRHSRVVLEKPIGYNQTSAEEINSEVGKYFNEKQIFRIDHYLGKETVQNLMILRFSNLLFENMWDRKSIDHIQISIGETVGLEGRAGFYNDAGAMRDMVQNHLLQLLCLIAMEPPNEFSGDNIRTEKIKVLKALRPVSVDSIRQETIRGQYVSGQLADNLVPGYLEELKKPQSFCETFVAIRTFVDNWRWSGVPFYLRTGKRLKQRCAEISVQFKPVSHQLFSSQAGISQPNRLIIRLQPEERIQLSITSKKLNKAETQLKQELLDLNLNDNSTSLQSDAYKRLLLDVIANDPSLFIHREEIDTAWRWVDPIIEGWRKDNYQPELYRAGSWGPESSDRLLANDGRYWHNPDE
ncbi:glucose-6-phosphate dehydrogenase [Aliikangiella sp. G2MR2-5]|uniref:glucose-6-phosphate dehydrogenase n=1 Tax=Aliikangiella sp. G2MR2-5 TaxID=2788943 RepID=UPI0018AA5189|nr:glucose-6-phosphate dehydrogenase [Aliikangiella sp. G2MR2-5]